MISRNSLLLCIATFGFLLVVVSASTMSLWFLRGVLGSSQGVVEVGYRQHVNIQSMVADSILPIAQSSLQFSPTIFSRLVYIQDRSAEYVVGIPKWKTGFGVDAALRDAGWNVSRIGWMVVGQRVISGNVKPSNAVRSISVINGLRAELSAVFREGLSANPLFFSRAIPGFSSIENGFAVYGDEKKHELHIAVSYNSQQFLKIRDSKNREHAGDSDTLNVAIYSELLALLPKEFMSAISANIDQRFHFTRTSPSLIAGIPQGEFVQVFAHGRDIALGVTGGAAGFKDTIIKDLRAEQGARHPQRKGFLLPDGTVGHEYVPSNPDVHFEKIVDTNCEKTVGYDEQLFMCKDSSEDFFIATSLDAAQKVVQNFIDGTGNVWGSIDAEVVRNILQHNVMQKIWFVGDDKGLMISGSY